MCYCGVQFELRYVGGQNVLYVTEHCINGASEDGSDYIKEGDGHEDW